MGQMPDVISTILAEFTCE